MENCEISNRLYFYMSEAAPQSQTTESKFDLLRKKLEKVWEKIPEPIKKYWIIIAGFLLLVSIMIYIRVWRKGHMLHEYDKPLPYIWDNHFHDELSNFLSLDQHRDILVIYGPSGTGKTRGLHTMADSLRNQDRIAFIFDFNLLSTTASVGDFIRFLQRCVVKACQQLDGKQIKNIDLQLTKAMATIGDKEMIKEIRGIPIKDLQLQKIAAVLIHAIEKIENQPGLASISLFEAIDGLSALRPTIFIHNIQNLLNSATNETRIFYSQFWKACHNFAQEYRSTAIVVEVNDESLFFDDRVPLNNSINRIVRVSEFTLESAKEALVTQDKIFTNPNLQSVYDKCDGNGRCISYVHELTREGLKISTAFPHFVNQAKDTLIRAIGLSPNPKDQKQNIQFLKKLLKSKKLSVSQISISTLKLFLNKRIITLQDLDTVSYQNKIIEKVAQEVLSQF